MALTIAVIANFVQMDNRGMMGGPGHCQDPEGCTVDPIIAQKRAEGKYDDMFYDDGK